MKEANIFDIVKFDEKGLITAIAQDCKTNEILMLAFMNEESLKLSLQTKLAHYFSRSRQKLWLKGETSGQIQEIKEILIDCDGDAIILKIEQKGKPIGVACHTGRRSCFFYKAEDNGNVTINQKVLIEESDLYADKNN